MTTKNPMYPLNDTDQFDVDAGHEIELAEQLAEAIQRVAHWAKVAREQRAIARELQDRVNESRPECFPFNNAIVVQWKVDPTAATRWILYSATYHTWIASVHLVGPCRYKATVGLNESFEVVAPSELDVKRDVEARLGVTLTPKPAGNAD